MLPTQIFENEHTVFVLDPLQCKKAATLFMHFTVQTYVELR